ncbi:MAG: type I-F CRISPR-associated protein Csy1, partial [Shewanella sp.]|nr:type I-F CRISPR-associated protein Csy1 [Shewanella sp.]
LEPILKRQVKEQAESEQAISINAEILALKERFSKDSWLNNAATKMAKQLNFGTHISKGVHPDSKGDNVNFRAKHSLPQGVVGTQLIIEPKLDANGNAAALPLAAFFNVTIRNQTLRDLILDEDSALDGVFADDKALSNSYCEAFKTALQGDLTSPKNHEKNKQLLWPLDNAITDNHYHCITPLYPSSLTHAVYHKINGSRFSEANKLARDNRKKKNIEHTPYVSINDLASIQLGGTNPRNVSLLTSKKGGRNYLLESLPPSYSRQHEFSISKREPNFFNKNLAYHCYLGLKNLFEVIEAPKSVMDVREQRKQALGLILGQVIQQAAYIQQHYSAGWSEDYRLNMSQKYWLDPTRAELETQESFKQAREKGDWCADIMQHFALWLNNELRTKFPKQKTGFDDTEYREWLREMETAIKTTQRAKQGVFL